MNQTHNAIVTNGTDGFSPAVLVTTTYGLRMILNTLRNHDPEPHETGLYKLITETLETELSKP